MSKLTRIIIVVVLVAGAGVGVYAWAPWAAKQRAPIAFETAKVDQGPIAARVTATGTLAPRNAVQVGVQVSGRVLELHADWNDRVKAGDLIARLEPQTFEAQVAQAKANLAVAKANLHQAEAESREAQRQLGRLTELRKRDLISASEADTAGTRAATTRSVIAARKAQVEQAEASLSQADLALGYTFIHSPVDGVVLQRSVDVGQTVAASFQSPILFTIAEDLARMQIDTSVAEGDVGRITQDMAATFSVDAFSGRSFAGMVRQVRNSPTSVQGVVTYNAVIDVANDDLALKPGMTANVTFVTRAIPQAIRIPNAALRFRPTPEALRRMRGEDSEKTTGGLLGGIGGPRQVASGGEGDGKRTLWKVVKGEAVLVRVKTGLTDGTWTELVEGELAPGDDLVTDVPASKAP